MSSSSSSPGDEGKVIEVFDQDREADADGEDSVYGGDFSDHIFVPSLHPPSPVEFTIVSKVDARRDLEGKIESVRTTLLLSRAEAIILLHHFNWNVGMTQEEWLECEEKVRKAVGLFERSVFDTYADIARIPCGICHGNSPTEIMISICCVHLFCRSCLTGYISEAINDGLTCLALVCPCSSCDTFVGLDIVESLSTEEDKKKFDTNLLESYLNSCKGAKSCPAPAGCEYIVFSSGGEEINYSSVTCRCLYRFCWNCSKEAHSPVDCCTAGKWMSETGVQSENWMIANTMPCPNCRISYDPDSIFTYLKCSSCHFEFCCDCGDNWYGVDCEPKRLYNNHQCRLDESSRPVGFRSDDQHAREIARKSLERYNQCYKKWLTIESHRADALTELKLFQQTQAVEISAKNSYLSLNEMDFLVDAHLQIVEGWQLLKWTYVYRYFLSEDEIAKMPLLEFTQERAEDLVLQLHELVKELRVLLYGNLAFQQFMDKRDHLRQLMQVTRTYLGNMERNLMPNLKTLQEESSSGTNPSPNPKQSLHGEVEA